MSQKPAKPKPDDAVKGFEEVWGWLGESLVEATRRGRGDKNFEKLLAILVAQETIDGQLAMVKNRLGELLAADYKVAKATWEPAAPPWALQNLHAYRFGESVAGVVFHCLSRSVGRPRPNEFSTCSQVRCRIPWIQWSATRPIAACYMSSFQRNGR
jgi:hypothetical protein